MFSTDEVILARRIEGNAMSYQKHVRELAAAVLREAEREKQSLDAVCGPIDLVPDERGGHLEFNGKIWRAERSCVLCGKPAERTCMPNPKTGAIEFAPICLDCDEE